MGTARRYGTVAIGGSSGPEHSVLFDFELQHQMRHVLRAALKPLGAITGIRPHSAHGRGNGARAKE
ncbi:hypothetical protein BGLA2_1220013 [Burkholderia gladioli]|nr:hypothetical protein BGLA2_1220013 [Burkholderia gladioli]